MKEVMNLQEKKEKDVDWWDELSEDERKAIEQGIKEADNGELKSHAEVLKERKAKYYPFFPAVSSQ